MSNRPLKVSYLSNVVSLYQEEQRSDWAWTIADNLAVFCVQEEDGFRPVEIELLDGAETLLPHFLPEEYGDSWPVTKWQPRVAYDRDRDILRLFNDETPIMSRTIGDSLIIGCTEDGRPVSAEILGAAELLLPHLLPVQANA